MRHSTLYQREILSYVMTIVSGILGLAAIKIFERPIFDVFMIYVAALLFLGSGFWHRYLRLKPPYNFHKDVLAVQPLSLSLRLLVGHASEAQIGIIIPVWLAPWHKDIILDAPWRNDVNLRVELYSRLIAAAKELARYKDLDPTEWVVYWAIHPESRYGRGSYFKLVNVVKEKDHIFADYQKLLVKLQ
jgi:hypothetical protein